MCCLQSYVPSCCSPYVSERERGRERFKLLRVNLYLMAYSRTLYFGEEAVQIYSTSYFILFLFLAGGIISCLAVGSGSLSSPMREHRNFAQFYCISVTNFSTVSEYILLEIIWIKRTFSSHSYGCFYVCMQCTSKNRQLIFYGRYLPFVRCWSRGPRLERKQSMCLSVRWQSDTRCTQQYVVSLDRKLNADSSGVNVKF